MDLFLDTGIYLSFYHYTGNDLKELGKLVNLVESGSLTLYLPDQVFHEYIRNRENKFADALKRFSELRLESAFPRFFEDYEPEYSQMQECIKSYKAAKTVLLEKVKVGFDTRALRCDQLISALFGVATKIDGTSTILEHAHLRHLRGNPPGKRDSLGDAICWESLLSISELTHKDIWIVAEDKDWRALTSKDEISPYLAWEWKEQKKGRVNYHRNLSGFFEMNFPHIKLASQRQKEKLIEELGKGRFQGCSTILEKIYAIGALSDGDCLKVVDAIIAISHREKHRVTHNGLRRRLGYVLRGRESLVSDSVKRANPTLFDLNVLLPELNGKQES